MATIDSKTTTYSQFEPKKLYTSFYNLLYEYRLEWTGHNIPVSYEDENGFYLEGYLETVAKADTLKDNKARVVPVYLSTYSPDSIYIDIGKIHPSDRHLTMTSPDLKILRSLGISYVSRIKGGQFETEGMTIDYKASQPISEEGIVQLFDCYPDRDWTITEIILAFGRQVKEAKALVQGILEDKIIGFQLSSKRACILTGEELDTYRYKKMTSIAEVKETIQQVKECFKDCIACELGVVRKNRGAGVVFGRGSTRAKAMIIGEGPGEMEETAGIPFNPEAPSGGVLARVMEKVGLNQDDFFLTNAVICRPEPEGPGRINGTPKSDHIKACNSRLKRTIAAIQPRLVIILGKIGYISFFGKEPKKMADVIGWQAMPYENIYVLYHPSFIVRQLSNSTEEQQANIKREYYAHWKTIAERFGNL